MLKVRAYSIGQLIKKVITTSKFLKNYLPLVPGEFSIFLELLPGPFNDGLN